jgi:hypothetical protein
MPGNFPPPRVRQHERADLDLYINKIIGDEPHLTRVRDISVSGVYLYKLLEPDYPDGTRVGLEIKLPGSHEVIWAVGEVVREEDATVTEGVAIKFTRLADHDRQLIADFVDSRLHAEQRAA